MPKVSNRVKGAERPPVPRQANWGYTHDGRNMEHFKCRRCALALGKLVSFFLGMLLLLPAVLSAQTQTQDWRKQLKSDTTLGTVRRLFLNQKVIVSGTVLNLPVQGSVLIEWTLAHKDSPDRYQASTMATRLPSTYKGRSATAVAVQLNELKRQELRPNAFGEIVAEDDMIS
jgi:hypothetical protein